MQALGTLALDEVLEILRVDFEEVVEAHVCDYYSKHSDESFKTAMRIAGAEHAYQCMLLDDSIRNINTAEHLGWHTGKAH